MPLFQCESVRNHSYENDFYLHENESACRIFFYKKGFALRLVLKQRYKRTRKWTISSPEQAEMSSSTYLLLTKFEVRTVCYGPSFFPFAYLWPERFHRSTGKNLQHEPRKRG